MPKEERKKPEKKTRKTAEAKAPKVEKPQKRPQLESPEKEDQPPQEQEQEQPKKTAKRNAKGQFVKGHTKLGGRQMGTPNKNSNIRDRLKEQLEPILDELAIHLLKIKQEEGSAEMLKTAEKYMPYVWPKYSSMAIGADLDRPISEEQRLLELDQMYTKKQISIRIKSLTIVDNDLPRDNDDPDDDPDFDLSKLEEAIERNS